MRRVENIKGNFFYIVNSSNRIKHPTVQHPTLLAAGLTEKYGINKQFVEVVNTEFVSDTTICLKY